MSRRLTTEEFVSKSHVIHGKKYDYSATNYEKSSLKICIYCPKHGNFTQTPNNHLKGKGCPKCKFELLAKDRRHTVPEFIEKANKIHKLKYSYPELNYVNGKLKISVLCPYHGMFSQIAQDHLSGHGCPSCKFEKLSCITQSKGELEFMDYLKIIPQNRHVCIHGYIVDGIDKECIWEFLGDYWHGNPAKFNPLDSGPYGKTFGEHHIKTFRRFEHLTGYGYKLLYIWESDWNNFKFGKDLRPEIKVYGTI